MTENEDAKSSATTSVLRVDKTIYDEVSKFATDNGLTLKDAADKIYFAKVAAVQQAGSDIDAKDDADLTTFGLAAKYVRNLPALKALIQSATLKAKMKYTEYLQVRIDKAKESGKVVEEVKVYCCPVCREQFATPGDVTGHFNVEHDTQQTSTVHLCPFCITETVFPTKSALANHMNNYHMPKEKPNINPPPSPIPPLQAKTVIKEVEIIKRQCLCGHVSKDATEQGQHLLKCPIIAKVAQQ